MGKRSLLVLPALVAMLAMVAMCACALAIASCGGEPFDPQSRVDSVRLFAVRADAPYAKPGERVTLEALMTDARSDRTRPLKLYWLPFVCLNPAQDLYYLCFVPSGGSAGAPARIFPVGPADAGADAGAPAALDVDAGGRGLGDLPVGVDLSPYLVEGTSFSFTMPADAVQPRRGTSPYGLAIVFNIACAGKVVLGEVDPAKGPQDLPIVCADELGRALPPSDYVIGISRVYSYTDQVNTNPVIDGVTLDGQPVDTSAGVTVERCTTGRLADCKGVKLDVQVPDSSWEDNPSPGAERLREQIWVDYYSDQGALATDARLLFDPKAGRVPDSAVVFRPFEGPGQGHVWIVVHDNRGGASWSVVPVRVR